MQNNLHPAYIYGWTEKIRDQLVKFKQDYNTMSNEDIIATIRRQYYLLSLINKALNGKVLFTGAYQPKN